jgi:hypothetical protein
MTASIPRIRVKRLNPAFERDKHLGPVTRRQAINRINAEADLARQAQIAQMGRQG